MSAPTSAAWEPAGAAGAGAVDAALSGPEPAWPLAALPLAKTPPLERPLNALAVDTTSDVLSLALLRDGVLSGRVYEAIGRRTTQEILPRIGALLADAGLMARALDVLVVARGPGSFTGTRIGMAVALTFAQVTGAALVGVDTLRLLAAQTQPGGRVAALLNCARDEVYCARYRWEAGGLAREGGMALRRLRSLAPELGETPVVLRRYQPGAGTDAEDEAAFAALSAAPLRHPEPDAALLLTVGLGRYLVEPERFRRAPESAVPRLEPIYLKSEAFRTWSPP